MISGSAIGFVISQAWWLIYQKFGPYCFWPCGELRKPFERLIEKYGLDDKLRERRTVMQVMYDYVIRSLPKDDPHLAYLVRRWDLWTLLWSEIFAVILGFAGGIVVFGVVSFVPIFFYFWFYNWIRILLTVLTPFVIICLLYGQKRILEETDVIAKAIINKTDVYYSLKRAFPEYFNDGNC
ncbi:MAG: hypothetical protein H3Z53_01755 [archaeon]|nr:hypothetical protein [archaeon]